MNKETNPKEAFGSAKPPTSTVPQTVVYELGLAMLEGALKYGRHNYRISGIRSSVYFDAAKRHLDAWWEGEDIDPESGLSHLVKAMACLAVMRDAQICGMVNDDRPPSAPHGWMEDMAAKVAALKERYPNPKQPYVRGETELHTEN